MTWSGRDPTLRRLRVLAALTLLGLLVWTIVAPDEEHIATIGTLVGALLVLLGFEVGLAFPGRRKEDDKL
jgi:hypothetical protein